MRVADLPLAQDHVAHFEGQGIEELYPPQADAVDAGICDGNSVVAAVPTASGKTMIAQLAALSADGPAVYVVPLRALATEKAETFDAIPGISVGVATGDFDATDEELAGHDVVVATAEKVDAAIRHEAAWVEQIACAILDEVHVLDQDGRGPTLEVTIAKLRRLNPAVQLVALSATVPNADEIADWLDAAVVRSEWRPVELRTGIYAEGSLVLGDGAEAQERPIDPGDLSATGALVQDALDAGGQCLVFVSSRREARQLASTLAGALEIEPASAGEQAEVGGLREDALAEVEARGNGGLGDEFLLLGRGPGDGDIVVRKSLPDRLGVLVDRNPVDVFSEDDDVGHGPDFGTRVQRPSGRSGTEWSGRYESRSRPISLL